MMQPPPYGPYVTAPIGAAPPRRFVKRGFYMCCVECGMAVQWCACVGKPALDVGSSDATADASLQKRIAECQGK